MSATGLSLQVSTLGYFLHTGNLYRYIQHICIYVCGTPTPLHLHVEKTFPASPGT